MCLSVGFVCIILAVKRSFKPGGSSDDLVVEEGTFPCSLPETSIATGLIIGYAVVIDLLCFAMDSMPLLAADGGLSFLLSLHLCRLFTFPD